MSYPCPKHRYLRLLIALILQIFVIKPVHTQCYRRSKDKLSSPQFLCSFEASITRLPGCSTLVVESILFPHISGNPWSREVNKLEDQSINLSSISVTREGRQINFTFDGNNRITVPAEQSDGPVRFELVYTVLNGVTKYIGGCEFTNDGGVDDSGHVDESEFNALYWTLGEWENFVEFLNVTFNTTDENVPLRFANGEGGIESGQQISVVARNVTSAISFTVLEKKSKLCTAELQCSDDEAVGGSCGWFSIFFTVIVGTIIGSCTCCMFWLWIKSNGSVNDSHGDNVGGGVGGHGGACCGSGGAGGADAG